MSEQEPRIFEIDPEGAPRMTAIILLVCGLLGVGFLLVNVFGTGDDPYYNQAEWEEGNEPVHQRYDILPNMVRGRQEVGDSDEDEEAQEIVKKATPPRKTTATTNPLLNPYLPTPLKPTVPGMPPAPGAPTTPTTPGLGTPPVIPARPGAPSTPK
jgi:hypothetical protein